MSTAKSPNRGFTLFALLAVLLFLPSLSFAADQGLLKAVARPGDGIYSLLRLYGLEKQSCNMDYFLRINELKKEQYLKVNQVYLVPVFVYDYNGKSIRSTIGINDWDVAVRVQNYNREMRKAQLQASEYEDSKVLWVPFHELECMEPKGISRESRLVESDPEKPPKPISVGFKEHTIFGPEYSEVPALSTKLEGKIYYIVSGHGGPDPGAIGKKGGKNLCEDEYAYDVSLRLTRNLISHGATAYMIIRDPNDGIRSGEYLPCDYDEECWGNKPIPLNAREKLQQRADAVNELFAYHKKNGVSDKDQTMIVIHVDSRSKTENIDLFFYHYPEAESGKNLANKLQETIRNKYHQHRPGRGYEGPVTGRDLFMLRETKPTAVYIELANIRNNYDLKRIMPERNRQVLADWLTDGLFSP